MILSDTSRLCTIRSNYLHSKSPMLKGVNVCPFVIFGGKFAKNACSNALFDINLCREQRRYSALRGADMTLQELLSPMRRAINDYDMICDNDKIAVGVSGGKDSLALLTLLKAYRRFSEHSFELVGVTVDMGFAENAYDPIKRYCDELDVEYRVVKTDIAEIIFDVRKEKNPCSLCAKMRRGALNNEITSMGFHKLALGHHLNDVVETFMLSLFYEGRLNTFQPKSYMSRSDVTLIRPMIYIDERDITGFAKNLPVVRNSCPADKHTEREHMKEILKILSKDNPGVTEKFANAIMHPERYNLWDIQRK